VEVTMLDPPLGDLSNGALPTQSARFDLNSSMSFGSIAWAPIQGPGLIVWSLVGMVCKVGTDAASGHYIAMMNQGGSWWCADDGKVTSIGSTHLAFENLRNPRLLLYSKTLVAAPIAAPVAPPPLSGKPPPPKPKIDRSKTEDAVETLPDATPVYPILDPVLPFSPCFDKSSPLEGWQQRFQTVKWMSEDYINPIISAARSSLEPIPATALKNIDDAIPLADRDVYDTLTYGAAENRRLAEGWLTNTIIRKFGEFLTILLERTSPTRSNRRACISMSEFIRYGGIPTRPMLEPTVNQDGSKSRPGPAFGLRGDRDHCWRNDRTVFSMSANTDRHFHAVIVFGPERLIVPYDGAAGACTAGVIEAVGC
jgi:hypothetical protein